MHESYGFHIFIPMSSSLLWGITQPWNLLPLFPARGTSSQVPTLASSCVGTSKTTPWACFHGGLMGDERRKVLGL